MLKGKIKFKTKPTKEGKKTKKKKNNKKNNEINSNEIVKRECTDKGKERKTHRICRSLAFIHT